MPPALSYITSLKHVTELKLEKSDAEGRGSGAGGGGNAIAAAANRGVTGPSNDAQFCCPITGLAFNGRFKFFMVKPTGLVVSETTPPPSHSLSLCPPHIV